MPMGGYDKPTLKVTSGRGYTIIPTVRKGSCDWNSTNEDTKVFQWALVSLSSDNWGKAEL